jgi:hypothetical protein
MRCEPYLNRSYECKKPPISGGFSGFAMQLFSSRWGGMTLAETVSIDSKKKGLSLMTDLMNLFFFVLCFGLGIGFVMFCERLR